jgi:phosphonate transport system permease protein
MRHGGRWGVSALIVVAVWWSVDATGIGPADLIEGREGGARLARAFLQPDLSGEMLRLVASVTLETLHISVAGLLIAVVIGLPAALLIAGNVDAPAVVRRGTILMAATLRGVPELLWALVFVATVGLGPAAGVYAIGIHGAGLLAKLASEQLEAVDPAPVEAIRMAGAGRLAVAALAVVPQARPGLMSLILYLWECNIRTATVVGFVGAGGIGGALDIALRLFRYEELSTLVLAVLVLILAVDGLSRAVRRRVLVAA